MNQDLRIDRLESALRNIQIMSRRAIVGRPEEVPQAPWDFILSSIEVYAEQALLDENVDVPRHLPCTEDPGRLEAQT